MNNYLLVMVAILEKAGVYTEKEAKKLAEELVTMTLPDTYERASELLKTTYERLELAPKSLK